MDYENFSIGTQPLLAKLQELLTSRLHPVDVVIVNLGTIVRNCSSNEKVKEAEELDRRQGIETDRPSKELLNESKNEMIQFIQHIGYLFNKANLVRNPTIMTYHANYRNCIPEELYRAPSHNKRTLTLADDLVRNTLITGEMKEAPMDKVRIIEIPMNDHFYPYQHLLKKMNDVNNIHNVIMLSSHPIDYHLARYCASFKIIRSFTGEVVDKTDLGKAIFHSEFVPFNIYTHALFGDKEDLKSSLKPVEKRKIEEIAEREKWSLKTQDFIKDRLYNLNIRIPINL